MDRITGILIVGLVLGFFVVLGLHNFNKNEYIYIARGVQCKNFDKDTNTLSECSDGLLENYDIINPISIVRIKK